MLNILRRGLLVLAALLPLCAQAESAHQVVQKTVDNLLSDLTANKTAYKGDPQRFYANLERILGPVVDSEGIAKGVMTVKYSRDASAEQIKRFEQAFKSSLFKFYGNALLEYDNQTIRVLPVSGQQEPDRESVNMEVVGTSGEIYPVQYTMVNQAGSWKLRNVIVNGINIGKLFRDQFAEAMQQNHNDLEKTIANWDQVVASAEQAAKEQKSGTGE